MVGLRSAAIRAGVHFLRGGRDGGGACEALGGQQPAGGPMGGSDGAGDERDLADGDSERVLRRYDGVQAPDRNRGGAGRKALLAGQLE